MNSEQPYILDIDNVPPNNIDNDSGETFKFSQNNIWNNSFLSPEISNYKLFNDIKTELEEIHILIDDIKNLLQDMFDNK